MLIAAKLLREYQVDLSGRKAILWEVQRNLLGLIRVKVVTIKLHDVTLKCGHIVQQEAATLLAVNSLEEVNIVEVLNDGYVVDPVVREDLIVLDLLHQDWFIYSTSVLVEELYGLDEEAVLLVEALGYAVDGASIGDHVLVSLGPLGHIHLALVPLDPHSHRFGVVEDVLPRLHHENLSPVVENDLRVELDRLGP